VSDAAMGTERYIDSLPPDRQEALAGLRAWVRETLPDATEVWQYGMPGFAQDDLICVFKSQKNYISLYLDVDILEQHKAELDAAGLNCGKSCIRFRSLDQLPEETIKTMLREIAAKQAAESAAAA
jgi:uncharacterized protein YdhG (YjbR/CyaY superfamily)